MKKIVTALLLGTALTLSHVSHAATDCSAFKGKTLDASISYVADGDTASVKLTGTGEKVKVRFYGVDTPESQWKDVWPAQAYSDKAKNFTVNQLREQNVQVTFTGDQSYSRCIGEIFLNGRSHSLALIEAGYAWWYKKYSPRRTDLGRAQAHAENSKTGLWASSNPMAPWDFRNKYR
jgi:endonuclease YncB( thermonuclease family)